MSRFPLLTAFAEGFAWQTLGFAQGLFDMAMMTVLALAIYATGVEDRPAPNLPQVVAHVAACQSNCVTSTVLKPQDS